jgi:hypothetical protein
MGLLSLLICEFSLQTDAPRTFVLEIGSEELPPQDVVSAVSQVTFFLAFFPQPFWALQISLYHGVFALYSLGDLMVFVTGTSYEQQLTSFHMVFGLGLSVKVLNPSLWNCLFCYWSSQDISSFWFAAWSSSASLSDGEAVAVFKCISARNTSTPCGMFLSSQTYGSIQSTDPFSVEKSLFQVPYHHPPTYCNLCSTWILSSSCNRFGSCSFFDTRNIGTK